MSGIKVLLFLFFVQNSVSTTIFPLWDSISSLICYICYQELRYRSGFLLEAFVISSVKAETYACNAVKLKTTMKMTMVRFTAYFQLKDRDEVYNVLSVEYTDTDRDKLVKRPKIVDLLDQITLAYPTYLQDMQKKKQSDILRYRSTA